MFSIYSKAAFVLTLSLMLLITTSCKKSSTADDYQDQVTMDNLEAPDGFDFSTKSEVTIKISAKANTGEALEYVRFSVHRVDGDTVGEKIFNGITGADGKFERKYTLPAYVEQIYVTTKYVGLVNSYLVDVSDVIDVKFENRKRTQSNIFTAKATLRKIAKTEAYRFLGSYNSSGLPDYLEIPGDDLDQQFLDDVNASFPESEPVPEKNPEYLADGNEINTVLNNDADVYVTFISEGAGYHNVLGFYSYPTGSAPATADDIDSITIIFPNVSFLGGGGELLSGDKVNIGHFPSGTEIMWILISDGWQGGAVTDGIRIVYSEPTFNPEYPRDPSYAQHNVILYDAARDITMMGFEDLDRIYWSDEDVNDALFYVPTVPSSSLNTDDLPDVTYTGDDRDGDGVNDHVDNYPDDPDRAYDNFTPSEGRYGCLMFEDLWPAVGDYDFNDLVVDYQFVEVANSRNEVIELQAQFVLKAIGASFQNALGFELPLNPSQIESVEGMNISGSLVTLADNNLEAGQDNAVVIVFDNANDLMSRPSGYYVNTQIEAPVIPYDTITVTVKFVSPVSSDNLGHPPYNPFIIANQDRQKEVHLAGMAPTSLAQESEYFDTADDKSTEQGWFRTSRRLPWALDISESTLYPREKEKINEAHLHFIDWVQSGGQNYSDWYKDKSGYRDYDKLYYF